MTIQKRNFLVGLTVIAAGGIFLWMFMRFGTKTAGLLAQPQVKLTIIAVKVDGLSEGSQITYRGVPVGRVLKLDRTPDGEHVTITALVDTEPPVPQNVKANIITTNLISGGATVALQLKPGETPQLPVKGTSYEPLTADWVGLQILPEEYGEGAKAVTHAVQQLSDTIQEIHDEHLVQQWHDTVANINLQVTKAGEVMDMLQKLAGDPAVQGDLRETIANVKHSSEELDRFASNDLPKLSGKASGMMDNANTTMADAREKFDDLSKRAAVGLEQVSRVLDDVQSITAKINKGQGTAGMVVNDPKLYQSLVDSARELNLDLKDLDRVMQQWEQEGFYLKLNK